ncbi:MAG TPA: arabinose ABC transporter substrate-binding protein [Stellaceae bacterium]|nr:arabinose ABC transporter substrate-binding protein [Stellaceae bacterium]
MLKNWKHTITAATVGALALGGLALGVTTSHAADPIKIGFIVKLPEQAWFINEQNAAEAAGKEMGFTVVKLDGTDGEKVLNAIDNLASQGAKGFVICPPDVRLGSAISARAKAAGMKVVTVDDQFVDGSGKPISAVPHLGMSGGKIGAQVGETIAAEMKRRGWKPEEVGAIRLSNYELPTAKERTDGATKALLAAGFLKDNIFDAPQRSTDTESGFAAASPVLAKQSQFKKWVIYALNEESVLGGVRATEQFKIPATDVIGVGINGSGAAFAEFQKSQPTGFFGTIAVSSTRHGRETAVNLVKWIKDGTEPPLLTETTGELMTRADWQAVKTKLGL